MLVAESLKDSKFAISSVHNSAIARVVFCENRVLVRTEDIPGLWDGGGAVGKRYHDTQFK
jgi:hypothetical protein